MVADEFGIVRWAATVRLNKLVNAGMLEKTIINPRQTEYNLREVQAKSPTTRPRETPPEVELIGAKPRPNRPVAGISKVRTNSPEMNAVLDIIEGEYGALVTQTKSNHLRISLPNVRETVIIGSTPSDRRSVENAKSTIRRILGIPI